MNRCRIFGLILLLLIGFQTLNAQNDLIHQNQFWLGYNLNVQLNPTYQLRQEFEKWMFHSPFRQHVFYSRTQLNRKLNNDWNAAAGFTYFLLSAPGNPDRPVEKISTELRPQINLTYQHDLNSKWNLQHRYQAELRFIENQHEIIAYATSRMRYKATISYQLNEQMALKAFDEIHVNFARRAVPNVFDQNRLGVSIRYMPHQNLGLELGYINLFQQFPNGREFVQRDIFNLTLIHKVLLNKK